ncbi:lasso peptide biosynthesis B2 protein [Halosimplex salinum]|uniref:lasso peptide biosynthesis B2 protein n=1 Tax=Halosimplex salinum TaxID=1710538 RepID=UPI0013DDD30C|nr:lasso peptide biosynthesis B2 protein [Halosimplex salinum]
MGTVARLRALSRGDYLRLFAASGLLVVARVGLSLWSLHGLRTLLVRVARRVTVPGSPTPLRVAWAVSTADRRLPGSRTCLMRSVATETLLRLYGYTPTHRLGVDREGSDSIEAHSWIELDGDVLIGGQPDLSRFDTLPPLNERERP